MIFSLAHKS